jgi:hypothetical protein
MTPYQWMASPFALAMAVPGTFDAASCVVFFGMGFGEEGDLLYGRAVEPIPFRLT